MVRPTCPDARSLACKVACPCASLGPQTWAPLTCLRYSMGQAMYVLSALAWLGRMGLRHLRADCLLNDNC